MSTNLNCIFVERTEGEWFYVLENQNAPKNVFDWMKHATAYGPFADFDSSYSHLDRNHANHGGFTRYALGDRKRERLDLDEDSVLSGLFALARSPNLPKGRLCR